MTASNLYVSGFRVINGTDRASLFSMNKINPPNDNTSCADPASVMEDVRISDLGPH